MMRRAATRRWVRGKIRAPLRIHSGAPSNENQTSERNIIGQEIKFKTPVVNSSLVPRDARINPRAVRLRLPRKKTARRST